MIPIIQALEEIYAGLGYNSRQVIEAALKDRLVTQAEFFECHKCLLTLGE